MTSEPSAPGTHAGAASRPGPGVFRRFVFPVLVVAVIAGAIWYLERGDGGGARDSYGVRSLPPELAAPGLSVGAQEGSLAPDFLLESLDGGTLRLSDLRGRPVVLNFWATWCKPCRLEMPRLVEAYERHRDQGLVVVGLNLQEGPAVIRPFAEDYGMDFPIVVDRDGDVGDAYRVGGVGTDRGLPTTFFIDRDGVIRSVFTGPFLEDAGGTAVQGAIGADELESRIAEILGEGGG
jgi:peroxiredoxin